MTEHEEMVAVLEWADKHLWGVCSAYGGWAVTAKDGTSYRQGTLYQALHKAWKEEHERKN